MSAVVLIVDDDPVQRRLLEGQLRRLDYDARTAEDGEGRDRGADHAGRGIRPRVPRSRNARHQRPRGSRTDAGARNHDAGHRPDRKRLDRRGDRRDARRRDDFVVKPVGPERLQVSIRNALKVDALSGEIAASDAGAAAR